MVGRVVTVCDDGEMDTDVVVMRPRFGRWLAGAAMGASALGAVTGLVDDAAATWRFLPLLGAVALFAWAAYWRPAVVVDPAGVELVNVSRTVRVPWPAVQTVETQWALTLRTAYGSYAAWAAPAPSSLRARQAGPQDYRHLPESTYGAGGGVRPGDLAHTDSGQAAAVVRRRWEELRDAGALDDPRLERDRPEVRWHTGTLAALVALVVTSVVTLAL